MNALKVAAPLKVPPALGVPGALIEAGPLADAAALALNEARGEVVLESLRAPDNEDTPVPLAARDALEHPVADTAPVALVAADTDGAADTVS